MIALMINNVFMALSLSVSVVALCAVKLVKVYSFLSGLSTIFASWVCTSLVFPRWSALRGSALRGSALRGSALRGSAFSTDVATPAAMFLTATGSPSV